MRRDNVKIALFFIFVSFVLTMSILMGIFFTMNSYVQQKKSKIPFYIFLKSNASLKDVRDLIENIKQFKGVERVKLIDKKEALKRMVKKFQIDPSLFVSNPFPYSVEVFFKPDYISERFFERFKEYILSPIVESVKYPKRVLEEIEKVHSKMVYFSEIVMAVLYGVEFIVFLSIMTIFYSHRKFDYDTLKFFGIKRFTIMRLFLKETMAPILYGFLFSVVLVVALYFIYEKYGQLPFVSKELFQSAQKDTFILNIIIGFFFTLFSSILVFLINDEKV